MQSANDLKQLLFSINHKSYPAYKSTRGAYQFPRYTLSIDHVQGDPFAAPSRLFLRFCGTFFQRPKAPHSHCFHRLFAVILSSVHSLFTNVSSFFSPHPLLFLYRYATI